MKKLHVGFALLPLVSLFVGSLLAINVWKVNMFIPIIMAIIVTIIIGLNNGFTYKQLESILMEGSARVLPVVYILILIGMIVATWIGSGIIPTIIYYGVKLIHPSIFLPTTVIVVGLVALALGSSFTAMGTVGVAFFGIGVTLGFEPGLVAGAVISGAIFGDKISPLSDTTNVAPMIVGSDLYAHVRAMLYDTIPAMILTLMIFTVIGLSTQNQASLESLTTLTAMLKETFVIHPLLLLVPVFVIVFLIKKPPVLPSLLMLVIVGMILMVWLQGASVQTTMQALINGYKVNGEDKVLVNLLNKGGINSMFSTIGMVLLAVGLGNLIEQLGMFVVLKGTIQKWLNTPRALINASVLTAITVGFASGSQFLANILTGRTFVEDFKKQKIAPQVLSRCMESGGTVGIMLVPWSVPCLYASQLFGINPWVFIPFTVFAIITPLMTMGQGMLGIGTIMLKEESHERC